MLFAACSHPPQGTDGVPPGPLASVRLTATDLWSGGDITVVSASFKALATLPSVLVAGAARPVRRIDDSTIAAQLPDTDAVMSVQVDADNYTEFQSSVTVHGFQQVRDGPLLSGFIQWIPGTTLVLGAGDVGLVEVDVRFNNVVRSWPDTVHSVDCVSGVGPSVRPGYYVLWGKTPAGVCSHPWVWQYGPTVVRTDSIANREGNWTVAEIGPGGVIQSGNAPFTMSHCDGITCVDFSYPLGQVTGVSISTTSRRAVLHNSTSMVVNASTGDTLYRLPFTQPGQIRVEDAAFSPAGDTIYAVGTAFAAGTGALSMVNVATGALLAGLTLPVQVHGVARDPIRPWIYVVGQNGRGEAQLLVLSSRTLGTLATLRGPAQPAPYGVFDRVRIVPDPRGTGVFVVATVQGTGIHGVSSRILSFGVPVPTGVAP